MNAIVRVLWIVSFVLAALSLILSYGFLPRDMILIGFPYASIAKSMFFNSYLIILAVLFFVARVFHKGIREMNWAFAFPFSRSWMTDPETRDKYREHIDSWITGIFMTFNMLYISTVFLIWGGNDSMVYSYQNVFIASLLFFSTVLILVLVLPPFLIMRGPQNN